MIVLLLLLFTGTAYAQECLPTTWEYPPELRGCPSILKTQKTSVTFPGQTPVMVVQFGTGQCAPNASCDPILVTLGWTGNKECWPEFLAPKRAWGHWSREVIDAVVVIGYAGTCFQKTGDYMESVPLPGPACGRGERIVDKVESSCETAFFGGQPEWFNPFYTEPVCSWSYLAGLPYCGDFEPVNK